MDFLAPSKQSITPAWKILLVDDEPEIHDVTRLVLGGFRFEDKRLNILSALTTEQAKHLLAVHNDIAMILLDVVMESDRSGLDLVEYIRNVIGNRNVRIVLRTGQPGQAPEHEVITRYDINDYKEKTELTVQKLATTMFASLRAYRDIMTIEANKRGLEQVIAASAHIFSHERTTEFASAVLSQLAGLVGMERGALYCCWSPPPPAISPGMSPNWPRKHCPRIFLNRCTRRTRPNGISSARITTSCISLTASIPRACCTSARPGT
jgi:CheY-like chemotaxis protein